LIVFAKLKATASRLKRDVHTLYLAARDPRTPWYAKLFVVCVVAYALSSIDLIPDPIPVIGYLDDLIVLPLGIYLALKMIPQAVVAECRIKTASYNIPLKNNWVAAGIIVTLWIACGMILLRYIWKFLRVS
jgi:uncharacterized membrane protein YkvA (DUF1232 family)